MKDKHARLDHVLDHWFGPADGAGCYPWREIWFKVVPEFDAELREKFLTHHEEAAAGHYDEVADTPFRALALLILLDQIPRNIFRGTARMYATDVKALQIAQNAVAHGFDLRVHHVPRTFFYTPFEHSEDMDVQRRSLELVLRRNDSPAYDNALYFIRRHAEIIERFGRFPHRNTILGRISTPEEIEFLKEKDSSF